MFAFLWLRATFPRYRYDQIMRLGWKALIPVTLVWLTGRGLHGVFPRGSVEGASLMQGIRSFLKTFLLWELLQGLWVTLKGYVRDQGHGELSGREDSAEQCAFAACMRCAAIPTARSAASPASSARRCARRSPSPSSRT